MVTAIADVRRLLKDGDFRRLFVEELGWDYLLTSPIAVSVDATDYRLRPIAQKRGAVVCQLDVIPEHPVRVRIERALAKVHFEHVVAYVDASSGDQVWQWARREAGRPTAVREYWLRKDHSGEALAQRLVGLTVTLDEEESLTLPVVTERMRRTFDADRITRAFYDRFKEEQRVFLGYIQGIEEIADRQWYASLMLNRLMFTYFIQRKGFLNNDVDYLRNRLEAVKLKKTTANGFLTFYRHFLIRLFHEGFGEHRANPNLDLEQLIGRVPYLNGGLFEVHEIERRYLDIAIPDEAFERVFEFFDRYTWHLDERPLRSDNEINPDVLGYIFEKYVNQKQMGAYYTKEDITEYMCANSIIPFLLNSFGVVEPTSSMPDLADTVSALLASDPDRYIHSPVRHGIETPLPEDIARGISPSTLDSEVSADSVKTLGLRQAWNRTAPSEHALPTETWREVIARRAYCDQLRKKLTARKVLSADQLITSNLDLRQLAQDVIEGAKDPSHVLRLWQIVGKTTILDPTCGSGAFLFAALNILEPIYEACIDRMESWLSDSGSRLGSAAEVEAYDQFRNILSEIEAHPNRRYYVLKNIILNNLFGVDIMEEAVEICKLRLFLKLAAQVEPDSTHPNLGIDPLPDIDFNIRCGNTLVGFSSYADMRTAIESKLGFEQELDRISTQAATLQATFDSFRQSQVDGDEASLPALKLQLRSQLAQLQAELNRYLAVEYGISVVDINRYGEWLKTHQPFHWFVEFYGIMKRGGFDLIVGNPPYVEYRTVQNIYRVRRPGLVAMGNLHAMVTEVSLRLLARDGAMSMIVPISLPSTDRLAPLRRDLVKSHNIWLSHFDFRPAKLFEGSEQRLTIFVLRPGRGTVYSTRYNRWYGAERPYLFSLLSYANSTGVAGLRPVWPKIDGSIVPVLQKICRQDRSVSSVLGHGQSSSLFYKNTGVLYYTAFTREAPKCFINGIPSSSSRETKLVIQSLMLQKVLHCVLNSNLFYLCYLIHSNCRDLNPSDIQTFKFPSELLVDPELVGLSEVLHENQQSNSRFIIRNQKLTGEVRLQGFQPGLSKPILDKVDTTLARYYNLTERELDLVINYDIKYRLGSDVEV